MGVRARYAAFFGLPRWCFLPNKKKNK
jgi:hypothetical protein